ncbi:MAG: glycine/sarcosine/betaine reductase selenoprotein B family protein [Alphaproteobacteria bacterium]
MVRLADMAPEAADHLRHLDCAGYTTTPWTTAPPLSEARIAIVSTAALQRRDDPPFAVGEAGYRVIAADDAPGDLVMSHISTNFDRTGFEQDLNVVFPLDRLKELAAAGEIAGVANHHYAFMGSTPPQAMAPAARELAGLMRADGVNTVFLVPV